MLIERNKVVLASGSFLLLILLRVLQTDNVPPQWINSTTDVHLIDQEMKYLSEHHFRTLSMADIGYNYTSNTLYIKRS
jgi:hypothetical protein